MRATLGEMTGEAVGICGRVPRVAGHDDLARDSPCTSRIDEGRRTPLRGARRRRPSNQCPTLRAARVNQARHMGESRARQGVVAGEVYLALDSQCTSRIDQGRRTRRPSNQSHTQRAAVASSRRSIFIRSQVYKKLCILLYFSY